MFKLFHVA